MIKPFIFLIVGSLSFNISIAQNVEIIKLDQSCDLYQRDNDLFAYSVNGGFNGFSVNRHNFVAFKNSLIKYGSIDQKVKSNTASFFFSKSSQYWFVEDYFRAGLAYVFSDRGKYVRYTRFSLSGKTKEKSFSEKQYYGKFAKENITEEALFFGENDLFKLYSYFHESDDSDSIRKYFLIRLNVEQLKLDRISLQITDTLGKGSSVRKWEFISAEKNQLVLALKNMDPHGNQHTVQINKYDLSTPTLSPQTLELKFETKQGFIPAPYTFQLAGSRASFNEFTIPDGIYKNYHFNYTEVASTGTSTRIKVSLPRNNTTRSHIHIIGNRIYVYGILYSKINAQSFKSMGHYNWYCKCFDLGTGAFLFDCDGDLDALWDQNKDQFVAPKKTKCYDMVMYVSEADLIPVLAFTTKKVPEMYYVTYVPNRKGSMEVNDIGEMDLGSSNKPWSSFYLPFVDIYVRNKKLFDSIDFKALKIYEKIIETDDSVYFVNYRGITGFSRKTLLHKFKKIKE